MKTSELVLFLGMFFISGCSIVANLEPLTKLDPALTQPVVLSACAPDTVLTSDCVASANEVVTSAIVTNISTFSNVGGATTVTASIPTGYYKNQLCMLTDSDLVAGNIRSGVELFGVTGTLQEKLADCTDNALNASSCSALANRYVYDADYGGRSATCSSGANAAACWTNATNRYVSSSLGANIEGANASLTVTIPSSYYDGSTTVKVKDSNLLASNITVGTTIFGVAGEYSGFQGVMASTQFRTKTQPQVTLLTESTAAAPYTNSSTGYRAVPDINSDDDGASGTSVTPVNRTGWGTATCGTSQATIALRIADCASNGTIGPEATWDGGTKGNAGQGTWKLVTRTGNITSNRGREVWQDQRTGLLWSSRVGSGINWCKASGSNNITNNPTAEVDPSSYCTNASYQNTGTGPATKAVSACFEDGQNYFTNTDGTIDSAGKAGLGLSSTPSVAWRLPSMNDYYLAEVNGIRFVLPDTLSNITEEKEWAVTTLSSNTNAGILYYAKMGSISAGTRTATASTARCVGR